MATAPVVIPYALTQLAEGVALDGTSTSAQTLFTVPDGARCVPMFVIFRDASASVNAGTTLSLGTGSTATYYVNASALLASMATTTGAVVQPVYGSSVATAKLPLQGGETVTATFAGTLTSNGAVKADVFGAILFT